MRLRLGAILLVAAITPLTAVTLQQSAYAGVDTTPPEIGDCHAYTKAQGAGASDRTPIVDCADPHTAITVAVVEFDRAPNWSNPDALDRPFRRHCIPAFFDALGNNLKAIRRSAYVPYTFIPTKAQRNAGAAWLRCDVALQGGTKLMNLAGDLTLGRLPLPASVAKCREGRRGDYAYTVCSRPHQYRATHSIRYPHSSWPGVRSSKRFAYRVCLERARALRSETFFYEQVASRWAWRVGYRHAVCLMKSRS
jgi:hypothetical protein